MTTPPGAPKLLYGDLTLLKWGMAEPISVLGAAFLDIANAATLRMTMGKDISSEAIQKMRFVAGGRTYINVSNSAKMQGKERVLSMIREMDSLSAQIFSDLDEGEYIPEKLPPEMKGLLPKMIFNNLGIFWQAFMALRNPDTYEQRFLDEIGQLTHDLETLSQQDLSLQVFTQAVCDSLIEHLQAFFAIVLAAQIAKALMRRIFKDDDFNEELSHLEQALPHNITIEMGLAMYRLAQFDEVRNCDSAEEFVFGLRAGAYPEKFRSAWDQFITDYGFRSPMEMDPGAARYDEQPERLFEQLRSIALNTDSEQNPLAIFERVKTQREQSYQHLLQAAKEKGGRRMKSFEKNYQVWITLGGYRETPKYYVSLIAALVRKEALEMGSKLVADGRLSHPEDVFGLTMNQLDGAMQDTSMDIRALLGGNQREMRRYQNLHEFPRLVDSRGKILRSTRQERSNGSLLGEPISPGVARGPVKVLHTPNEKPVLPGDILVARATDPGWTPLFLNASGVILEVGGMLQHGALVAREYGKPCVAGIENAVETLHDGQLVELDGSGGVVRLDLREELSECLN
jgi:pyruvate,water dikinase